MGRRSRTRAVRATDESAAGRQPRKEVPTLREFAPTLPRRPRAGESAEAERDRGEGDDPPRAPAPGVGPQETRRDQERGRAASEAQLETKSPKTVNNILAVLSVLLKKAVEWDVIERMPCTIKLLPVPKGSAAFHDFDEYERLVDAARSSIRGRT